MFEETTLLTLSQVFALLYISACSPLNSLTLTDHEFLLPACLSGAQRCPPGNYTSAAHPATRLLLPYFMGI